MFESRGVTSEWSPCDCYWLVSSVPIPTHHCLESQIPLSHKALSWNEILGCCTERYDTYPRLSPFTDRIRRVSERLNQTNRSIVFDPPKDMTVPIEFILKRPLSTKSLALLDQLLFHHIPSQSLFPLFQAALEREYTKRKTVDHSASEENQTDESVSFSAESRIEEFPYSRLLQIGSTHFDSLFSSSAEELHTVRSLGETIASLHGVKCGTEAAVKEDILRSVCENQFLMASIARHWIPQRQTLNWCRCREKEDTEVFQFDTDQSSEGVSIDTANQSITNVNANHRRFNIGVLSPPVTYGTVECRFRIEEDRVGDEMVCLGVCTLPIDTLNYEESTSLWM